MKNKKEKVLGKNERIEILGTTIDVLNMEETVDLVEEYIKAKEPLHLMGVNADKINELGENEDLRKIVNNCGIINADGASVVKASKVLGKPLPERVAGIDLMQKLIKRCEEKGYRVYLLGAKQEVVIQTAQKIKEQYPQVNICGYRNGYFKKEEWPKIAETLESADPDIVFVGITSPTKEYLIDYLQGEGLRSVFMGVGGSFDVISGNIPRAPLWMQKAGLEWLFRVIQEPRRLFKRYFVGNTKFIRSVMKEKRKNDAR